ncbi:MAG: germination protein YpeB [Clostridia bacterium]|nr:germination protein YpeB [Clostridia bacterium]
MSRKITTIALSLALLAAAGWGLWERSNRITLANAVEAAGQRDFYNMLNYVEQAQVSMGKSLASNSPRQQAVHLTEAWNQAAAAHRSLSQLPMPDVQTVNTRKFLAQCSDYNNYLAQKLARGESLTAQEQEQLVRLSDEMGRIVRELRQTESQVANRSLRWSSFYKTVPAPLQTIASLAVPVQAEADPLDGFVNTERALQTLPTLNYDGPFSDHLEKQHPRGLSGNDVSQAEAEKLALEYCSKASNGNYQLKDTRNSNGRIPTFAMNLADTNRPEAMVNVNVSKQGGKLISLLNYRAVETPTLDADKARERAEAFLKSIGFNNMQPTYSVRSDNNQVITFAAQEGDVTIYPDQVKVKVALDNGEITGWDAAQYYLNNHQRQIPRPQLTPEQARAKVNPGTRIDSIRLALIPLPGGKEKLTYEIKAIMENNSFLIYIDAQTGEEERVLQIIDVPGGQLTM